MRDTMAAMTSPLRRVAMTGPIVLTVAACAGAPSSPIPSSRESKAMAALSVPRGATIGPSGYATIVSAPPTGVVAPSLAPPPPPPRDGRATPLPMTDDAIAARERMANPDETASNTAYALNRRLAAAERGNYIGLRIVRNPKARFAFQFRRDAAATLARHTRDPRFTSREGGVPAAELQPLFDTWWKRFEPFRLVGGGAVYEFDGVVRFDMNVDEAQFREIAARERWILPPRLELDFSPPRNPRSVDPMLARYVRFFAREDRRPAISLLVRMNGRVILRDGCFRLGGGTEEPLVLFGRDVELVRDDAGYMALSTPGSGRSPARIGERMIWGGPNSYAEADPSVTLLREQCGAGPIVAVGEPESAPRVD